MWLCRPVYSSGSQISQADLLSHHIWYTMGSTLGLLLPGRSDVFQLFLCGLGPLFAAKRACPPAIFAQLFWPRLPQKLVSCDWHQSLWGGCESQSRLVLGFLWFRWGEQLRGEGTRYYLCSNMAFLPPTGWLPHSDKSSPHSERTSDIQRHFCHHKTISEGENCKQGERFPLNLILFFLIFHDFFFLTWFIVTPRASLFFPETNLEV